MSTEIEKLGFEVFEKMKNVGPGSFTIAVEGLRIDLSRYDNDPFGVPACYETPVADKEPNHVADTTPEPESSVAEKKKPVTKKKSAKKKPDAEDKPTDLVAETALIPEEELDDREAMLDAMRELVTKDVGNRTVLRDFLTETFGVSNVNDLKPKNYAQVVEFCNEQ